jgi:hypothetical protein
VPVAIAQPKYSAAQIAKITFSRKDSPDLFDSNGFTKAKRCHLCKWYIEQGNLVLSLSCKHRLHKKCLEVWFLESNQCPVCAEP